MRPSAHPHPLGSLVGPSTRRLTARPYVAADDARDLLQSEIKETPGPEQLALVAHGRDTEARDLTEERGVCRRGAALRHMLIEPGAQRTCFGNRTSNRAPAALREPSVTDL